MSVFKIRKIFCTALVAALLLLSGCGNIPVVTGTPHDITTPDIPEGVLYDLPDRFYKSGDTLYCAADDSIVCYDGTAVSLLVLADQPSFLCSNGSYIVYRSVKTRVNFVPSEYEITAYNLASGQTTVLYTGMADFVACMGDKVYYITGLQTLYSVDIPAGEHAELLSGELAAPYVFGESIYLGIDGALCHYDAKTDTYTALVDKVYPQNISGDAKNVYYCTEDSLSLSTYNLETGEIAQSSVLNNGLTLSGGEHYYVVSNGGFKLMRASDDHMLLNLGNLQNCTAPYFDEADPNNVYFFINADDYYGMVRCVLSTGEIVRLSVSEG